MTSILVESNRILAIADVERSLDEEASGAAASKNQLVQDNAQWETTIQSGIPLRPGDEISMQSCQLNVQSAGAELMSIVGKGGHRLKDKSYKKDNETILGLSYYISNNHQFNFNLPSGRTRVRYDLYHTTFGYVDLTGSAFGVGDKDAAIANPTHPDTDAGFEAFSSATCMRALEAVEYGGDPTAAYAAQTTTGEKRKTLEDPLLINCPVLTSTYTPPPGIGNAQFFRQHTPTTKGPAEVQNPSNHRFYIPRLDKPCTGPILGLRYMGDLTDAKNKWDFLVRDVKLTVPPQMTTPARLSNILTGILKERVGNAIKWENDTMVEAGTYKLTPPLPASSTTVDTTERALAFTPVTQITSNTYLNWPTFSGAICRARYTNEWEARFDNEHSWGSKANDNSKYSTEVAYRLFWRNVISANPFEWRCVTHMYPLLQRGAWSGTHPLAAVNDQGLWTGSTALVQQGVDPDPAADFIYIADCGAFPCILNKNLPSKVKPNCQPLNPDPVYRNYLGTPPNATCADNNMYAFGSPSDMTFLDLPRNHVVTTNIGWWFHMNQEDAAGDKISGYILELWNQYMDDLMEHLEPDPTEIDTPLSQSAAYFNNSCVKYKLGRIDDGLSFSGAEVSAPPNAVGQPGAERGATTGANVFVPNLHLTHIAQTGGWASLPPDILLGLTGGFYSYHSIPKVGELKTMLDAPCWATWNNPTPPFNNEAQDRCLKGYRYLPIGLNPPPTADNLYHRRCNTWLGIADTDEYQTGPDPLLVNFTTYTEYYNKMAKMNNGKGLGILPMFAVNNTQAGITNRERKSPLIGIINRVPIVADDYLKGGSFPHLYKGEYIMLGSSPSLSQNLLAFASTTAKTDPNKYPPGDVHYKTMGTAGMTVTDDRSPNNLGNVASDLWKYVSTCQIGATNPSIQFDDSMGRFVISDFATAYFKGNGVFQNASFGPNADPETKELLSQGRCAAFSRRVSFPPFDANGNPIGGSTGESIYQYGPISGWQDPKPVYNPPPVGAPPTMNGARHPWTILSFGMVTAAQDPYPVISTQAGIAIKELRVPNTNGVVRTLTRFDQSYFKDTLFWKMGFILNSLKPLAGSTQCIFNRSNYTRYIGLDQSAFLQYANQMIPFTLNGYISSASMPGFIQEFGNDGAQNVYARDLRMPAYNVGSITDVPGAVEGASDLLIAKNLPRKLQFPLLHLKSNIIVPCGYQYVAGPDQHSSLNVVAQLTINYASEDFYFVNRSDLVYRVSRPYVITSILSAITFPDGSSASNLLSENSCCTYRIDFAPEPVPPAVKDDDAPTRKHKVEAPKDDGISYAWPNAVQAYELDKKGESTAVPVIVTRQLTTPAPTPPPLQQDATHEGSRTRPPATPRKGMQPLSLIPEGDEFRV